MLCQQQLKTPAQLMMVQLVFVTAEPCCAEVFNPLADVTNSPPRRKRVRHTFAAFCSFASECPETTHELLARIACRPERMYRVSAIELILQFCYI